MVIDDNDLSPWTMMLILDVTHTLRLSSIVGHKETPKRVEQITHKRNENNSDWAVPAPQRGCLTRLASDDRTSSLTYENSQA